MTVDASKAGCGTVLIQNNLPCAYARMTFTETQCRYAQIEKELLAIVSDTFHQFVFGKKVVLGTDYVPLIIFFCKTS